MSWPIFPIATKARELAKSYGRQPTFLVHCTSPIHAIGNGDLFHRNMRLDHRSNSHLWFELGPKKVIVLKLLPKEAR